MDDHSFYGSPEDGGRGGSGAGGAPAMGGYVSLGGTPSFGGTAGGAPSPRGGAPNVAGGAPSSGGKVGVGGGKSFGGAPSFGGKGGFGGGSGGKESDPVACKTMCQSLFSACPVPNSDAFRCSSGCVNDLSTRSDTCHRLQREAMDCIEKALPPMSSCASLTVAITTLCRDSLVRAASCP